MPAKTAEIRELGAERQIDLPAGSKLPFEGVQEYLISLAPSLHGTIYALSNQGRVFTYTRAPDRQFEPGVHMAWIEMRGPKF